MNMEKLILPIFIVISLFLASSHTTAAHAQSPVVSISSPTIAPIPTAVKSDFALDLEDGEKSTANDQEAKQNQKDQKDNENIGVNEQGQVENEQEGIDEQDMKQSSDDLNQEGKNGDSKGSMQDKVDGEKSDNSGKSTDSNSPLQDNTTNGGNQQE